MASTAQALVRLVRFWWVTALLAVVGALIGLGYALLTPETYVSKAYVVVVAEDPAESTTAVSYAQTYARTVLQGDVIGAAASSGQISGTDLRRHVQASGSPDAPVIEITGSADTAARSAELANVMAGGLVSTANDRTASTRMRLTVLSAASPPSEPSSPRPFFDVAVGTAAGTLLGGLAALTGTDRIPTRPGRGQNRDGERTAWNSMPPTDSSTPAPWTGRVPADKVRTNHVEGLPHDPGPTAQWPEPR
jgi:capsular polysaccharide biosynthesis protein